MSSPREGIDGRRSLLPSPAAPIGRPGSIDARTSLDRAYEQTVDRQFEGFGIGMRVDASGGDGGAGGTPASTTYDAIAGAAGNGGNALVFADGQVPTAAALGLNGLASRLLVRGCVTQWRGMRLEEDGRRRSAVNLRLVSDLEHVA